MRISAAVDQWMWFIFRPVEGRVGSASIAAFSIYVTCFFLLELIRFIFTIVSDIYHEVLHTMM